MSDTFQAGGASRFAERLMTQIPGQRMQSAKRFSVKFDERILTEFSDAVHLGRIFRRMLGTTARELAQRKLATRDALLGSE
jgi:hypothetical protein